MKPGDVCLALFPFGGAGGRKMRPVLVLTAPLGNVPEYVVAYVTSAVPTDLLPSDLPVDPAADAASAATGLTTRSVIRLHKLATLHQRDLVRALGCVADVLLATARERLRVLLVP